jgi:hypothetical protein
MSQKLLFKFKYLKLELEETSDLSDKYNSQFNEDFREEIEYLNEINSKKIAKKKKLMIKRRLLIRTKKMIQIFHKILKKYTR